MPDQPPLGVLRRRLALWPVYRRVTMQRLSAPCPSKTQDHAFACICVLLGLFLRWRASTTPQRGLVRHRPRPRGRVRFLTAARFRGRALARFFVSAGRRQKNKTGKNPWADFFPPSRRGRRKGLPFFCFCSPKGEPNKRASHVCEALCFGVLYGFF